jgi:hypothetical protein
MTDPREWPIAELGNVQRLQILSAVIPNAAMAEAVVEAPFDRAWRQLSDLEHSVPVFDGLVSRLQVVRRDGDDLKVRAWTGPIPVPFDVLLQPTGWCLMTAAGRAYVVGMCADPLGPERTRVAIMEALPRRVGQLIRPRTAHHVRGDVARMRALLEKPEAP